MWTDTHYTHVTVNGVDFGTPIGKWLMQQSCIYGFKSRLVALPGTVELKVNVWSNNFSWAIQIRWQDLALGLDHVLQALDIRLQLLMAGDTCPFAKIPWEA